jgi:uncharacterized membrane protein (DUF485 family)
VTAPRTDVRRQPRRAAQEIDDQTELGTVYLRSLLWAQLRLSVAVLVTLALTVGSLPLLFRVAPELLGRSVLGMPLTWGLLGFLVYPLLLALGWFYVRRAERHERAFADLVDR